MSALRLINARLPEQAELCELRIENGYFVSHFSAGKTPTSLDLKGQLVLPGLLETHIHLDKACIMSRCQLQHGTLAEAVAQTRQAKAAFTEDDVYQRGAQVLEQAILQGTTHMRTHVEIDPQIGLIGLHAVQRLREDYAWAISLQICVFPQEGMLNNPGTEALLVRALQHGADLLGGCPYTDSDPDGQIERLFELAQEYDCDLDFHLDFDLNPQQMGIDKVIDCAERYGWQGRVTVGHVTKLSALPREALLAKAAELAQAGVNVTCLPSTDLFLTGREQFHNKPRGLAPLAQLDQCGVTCSLSTNNIDNPFTPYGDASLVRQANLFANASQLGTETELLRCLAWVSTESARLLRLPDYGLSPGCKADFVVFDAPSAAAVVAQIKAPLMGFKAGRQTFAREQPQLLAPHMSQPLDAGQRLA